MPHLSNLGAIYISLMGSVHTGRSDEADVNSDSPRRKCCPDLYVKIDIFLSLPNRRIQLASPLQQLTQFLPL